MPYAPCWRVRLVSPARCSEGNPPSSSQENPRLQCDHRRAGSASSYISHKKQHRALTDPLPSFLIIWHGCCQRLDTRHDGPMVCSAAQFLYSCVTLLFLFCLPCVCLLCSLVELEKEVNNIKTGLKAVEAVSIWRFPKHHTYNISLRIRGTIHFMIRESGLSFAMSFHSIPECIN